MAVVWEFLRSRVVARCLNRLSELARSCPV